LREHLIVNSINNEGKEMGESRQHKYLKMKAVQPSNDNHKHPRNSKARIRLNILPVYERKMTPTQKQAKQKD